MTKYRRKLVPGGTYFFTVALAKRSSKLLVEHISLLRMAVPHTRICHPFEIIAWVVLPEHIHAVWMLPPGDADYPTRWRLIKSGFSRALAKQERRSRSRVIKGERGIWQRRYSEHAIQRHLDYVHYNPVKHGLVARVCDRPFSTFHRYVKLGMCPEEWGNVEEGVNLAATEPVDGFR